MRPLVLLALCALTSAPALASPPVVRAPVDPDVQAELAASSWDDAAAAVRGALATELEALDLRPDTDGVDALRELERSRRDGAWLRRQHLRRLDEAVANRDLKSASLAVEDIESIDGQRFADGRRKLWRVELEGDGLAGPRLRVRARGGGRVGAVARRTRWHLDPVRGRVVRLLGGVQRWRGPNRARRAGSGDPRGDRPPGAPRGALSGAAVDFTSSTPSGRAAATTELCERNDGRQ